MAIDRRNPFISLREGMERLLQESSMVPSSIFDVFGQRSFPVDLAESETQFVLRASLPGMKPDDVQITVQNETLTISGTIQETQEPQGQQWLLHEQRAGAFQRTLRLPTPINADHARASFEDGMLTLTLPKAEAAKVQHIKVSGQPAKPRQEPASAAPESRTDEQVREQVARNQVEEASQESFPASDSPSWAAQPQ